MSRSARILALVVVAWIAASPFLWRTSIAGSTGVPIPWKFMLQPVALAAIGLPALPGLWRGVRRVAWSMIAAVAVVVLSQLTFPSATPAGVVMNGALLCVAAVQALRASGRLRRVPVHQP